MVDLDLATNLCNEGKFEEALPLFDKILKVNKDGDIYRMKAQALMMLKRYDEATDTAIEALRLNPKNVYGLIVMGNIYIRQDKRDEAMTYYNEAIKINPNDVIALNNIGATLLEQELYDEAISTFDKALESNKTYANTYYGKAVAYMRKGDDQKAWEILIDSRVLAIPRKENPQVIEEMNKVKVTVARRIVEKYNGYLLVGKIIEELEQLGGMEIKTEESEKMHLSAKLEYGLIHDRPYHKVIYNPKKRYFEHLMIHELTHLRMIINASKKGENIIPVTDTEQKDSFHRRFAYIFNSLKMKYGEENAKKFEDDMLQGFTLQLFNCPLDLLVEDYIYKHYPELRPMQFLSLFSQEGENIDSIKSSQNVKEFPPAIVRASKIMNLVTSMHLEELYGVNLQNYFHPNKKEYEDAKDLYEEYQAYRDDMQPGEEYELCKFFIDTLQFNDLIVWVKEDVFKPLKSSFKEAFRTANAPTREEVETYNKDFAEKHADGENEAETMMMAMYMLDAMQRFDKMQHMEVKKIAMEIATIGITGISPSNTSGYKVPYLGDEDFGGYKLLAYYYVSFARELPELLPKLNLPFSKAYELALQLNNNK